MKRLAIAVWMLLLINGVATAQTLSIQSLIGRWDAVDDKNEKGGLEVIDSTRIYLMYGDQKKLITSYKADFTKSPCWFDFTVKDSTNEIHLKSLLQFINKDLVQWQIFDGDTRPIIFATDRGDMLYLKRKN